MIDIMETKVIQFNTYKDFFHFANWFEGELIIRKNKIYHQGKLIAIKV
jgi:hypothetical protein